jgi:hypothetical protein
MTKELRSIAVTEHLVFVGKELIAKLASLGVYDLWG